VSDYKSPTCHRVIKAAQRSTATPHQALRSASHKLTHTSIENTPQQHDKHYSKLLDPQISSLNVM